MGHMLLLTKEMNSFRAQEDLSMKQYDLVFAVLQLKIPSTILLAMRHELKDIAFSISYRTIFTHVQIFGIKTTARNCIKTS